MTEKVVSSQTSNKVEQIATAMRQAILEQALVSGTRLPEDMIGRHFGVSRTLVRSAITQLASEGLIDQRPNRGAVVIEPSWDEARDTFDLRIAVEEIVVSRLVGELAPEQIQLLKDHVDKETEARNTGNEARSIRLASEFHMLLADLTDSPILARYMRELASRCCLILATYSRPHSSECAVSEHHEIIELLQNGEPKAVVKAMTSHLKSVMDRASIKPSRRSTASVVDILASYTEK